MAGIITEAFQELNLLKEEAFEGSKSGLDRMADFLDDDQVDETQEVIAPDAETEDDLEDSYVGKVIFKCPSCRTLIYHDKENINFDEDSDVVNIDEECPYCHSVGGFEIVGEVVPYADVEVKVDDEVEVEEKVEEACNRKRHLRVKEALTEADKPAATSIEDAQKWVDYDMKKYGKISDRTNRLIKKAGFQIIKDDYGDYEVAAGHFESLEEATPDSVEIPAPYNKWFTFSSYIPDENDYQIGDRVGGEGRILAYIDVKPEYEDIIEDLGYYLLDSERYPVVSISRGRAFPFRVPTNRFESLNENAQEKVIKGDPVITWRVEDEERYASGEPYDDLKDLAAYAAYLVAEAGEKLYAFGGVDDEDNTMMLDITGDGKLRRYSYVKGRLYLEENLVESKIKPDYVLEEDDYIFHEDTGDIAVPSDLVDFESDRHINIKFADDNADKVYEYKMKKISEDGNYVECEYISDKPLKEARDLTKTPGTLAKLFNDHIDEINAAATGVPELKAKLKEIVANSNLADKPAAQKFQAVMDSKKNVNALLSTIATYLTGMKSESVEDVCPECGKTPCECQLDEDIGSWIAAKRLQRHEKKGKDANMSKEEKDAFDAKRKYLQTKAAAGAKKVDPITGKGPNATQRALNKADQLKKQGSKRLGDQTRALNLTRKNLDALISQTGVADEAELRKKLKAAGISVAEALRMEKDKLTEAFEKVELETAAEKITVKSEPREIEAAEETIAPLTPEEAEQLVDINDVEDIDVDIDEFDEAELSELGESYLKRVYENVNSFKAFSGKLDNNKLIIEGLITFNSGKTRNTSFHFSPSAITKTGKVKLIGENLSITKRKGAFTLSARLDGKKLLPESLTYNYSVKPDKNTKAQRVYGRVTIKR